MCVCLAGSFFTCVCALMQVELDSHGYFLTSLLVGEFPNEPGNLHLSLEPTTAQNYAQTLKILHSNFS